MNHIPLLFLLHLARGPFNSQDPRCEQILPQIKACDFPDAPPPFSKIQVSVLRAFSHRCALDIPSQCCGTPIKRYNFSRYAFFYKRGDAVGGQQLRDRTLQLLSCLLLCMPQQNFFKSGQAHRAVSTGYARLFFEHFKRNLHTHIGRRQP